MWRMGSAEAIEKVAEGVTALADIDLDALPDAELDDVVTALQRLTPSARRAARAVRAWLGATRHLDQ